MHAGAATDSSARSVRVRVLGSPVGTFLRCEDFESAARAVYSELSRLVIAGEIVRVRRGLYYRGKATRFGMTRPSLLALGIAVAGPGSGPVGVTAAHWLGLTTQVPGVVEIGAPGRAPASIAGVRFRARPIRRRGLALTPVEVAVIEILRDPGAAEATWTEVCERVAELFARGTVRAAITAEAVASEAHVDALDRWHQLAPPPGHSEPMDRATRVPKPPVS
jgi:hypothetical protein